MTPGKIEPFLKASIEVDRATRLIRNREAKELVPRRVEALILVLELGLMEHLKLRLVKSDFE